MSPISKVLMPSASFAALIAAQAFSSSTAFAQVVTTPNCTDQTTKEHVAILDAFAKEDSVTIMQAIGNGQLPTKYGKATRVWDQKKYSCTFFIDDAETRAHLTTDANGKQVLDLKSFGIVAVEIDGKTKYLWHSDDIKKTNRAGIYNGAAPIFPGKDGKACSDFAEGLNVFSTIDIFQSDRSKVYITPGDETTGLDLRYYPIVDVRTGKQLDIRVGESYENRVEGIWTKAAHLSKEEVTELKKEVPEVKAALDETNQYIDVALKDANLRAKRQWQGFFNFGKRRALTKQINKLKPEVLEARADYEAVSPILDKETLALKLTRQDPWVVPNSDRAINSGKKMAEMSDRNRDFRETGRYFQAAKNVGWYDAEKKIESIVAGVERRKKTLPSLTNAIENEDGSVEIQYLAGVFRSAIPKNDRLQVATYIQPGEHEENVKVIASDVVALRRKGN